ncbi:MAG: sigma-54 dependent transcriptional regulator [Myxococcota bacterium]
MDQASRTRILVVEDEFVLRSELERLLMREGFEIATATDVPAARALDPLSFDLILTDLRLPGGIHGDVLIDEARGVPVIMLTSFGTVSSAVDAMKRGALDYLSKPIDPSDLLAVVHRALRGSRLASAALDHASPRNMVGESEAMQKIFRRIDKVAPTGATVLILGQTGTGKELVARALHANSKRSRREFVPVNCASIPEGLIESELFGHVKGAFTGAATDKIGLVQSAHEGTLFLDEVGELPAAAQARLLRVLQEREVRPVGSTKASPVDVRLLCATHRDLPQMVAAGTFREDLYFRLKVVDIELPPLAERGEDIIALAEHVLSETLERAGEPSSAKFTQSALDAMRVHAWPGNVRELTNAVERAVILHDNGELTPELLGLPEPSDVELEEPKRDPISTEASLDEYFVQFVLTHQDELRETELAKRLGISRKTLWQRRKKFGIPRT